MSKTKETLKTTKITVDSVDGVSPKESTQTTQDSVGTKENTKDDSVPKPRRRGRPPKKAVSSKKPGARGQVGRPKGDAAIMNEYKARMLASPKSRKVLDKIFEVALDDDHKNQAACMKMVVDRMLPVSAFEREVSKGNGRNSIEIKISGVTASVDENETIDAEFEEI